MFKYVSHIHNICWRTRTLKRSHDYLINSIFDELVVGLRTGYEMIVFDDSQVLPYFFLFYIVVEYLLAK